MPKIKEIGDGIWEIPKEGKMRVPARIYALPSMMEHIQRDGADVQAANVAWLPGIVNYSLAMPDIHWGYGFPIGGVAAFDLSEGVISPGGVGYDINCGVRLLATKLQRQEVQSYVKHIIDVMFHHVPTGVGSKGELKIKDSEYDEVMLEGAGWAVRKGYGKKEDLEYIEEHGMLSDADPAAVSNKARERGYNQLGTLGSGNHFLEIAYVDEVYNEAAAQAMGLGLDTVTFSIHCGSRGFGHQVCTDFIGEMNRAVDKYKIEIPDRQLCCAPVDSPEGRKYFKAMAAAVNFAFANRQVISAWTGEALEQALQAKAVDIGLRIVYEVAHNIAKIEEHVVDGKKRRLCVHRKGATRAFGPGNNKVPVRYRDVGQPVLVPGDMGRYSYVLVGTDKAMTDTFGSACHGAGRCMSRNQAIKAGKGRAIHRELEDKGICVLAASRETLCEEMPEAYKDVSDVVEACVISGIAKKVVRLKPLGCIKG